MHTPNGTNWYLFCIVWSSTRLENCSNKWQLHTSGKITLPRFIPEHLIPKKKQKKKHQITNIHIKWDCLITILFSLVKYYLFFRLENVTSGKITMLPRWTLIPKEKHTPDYEYTHQVEPFDTHFGQALLVSGLKTLIISDHYSSEVHFWYIVQRKQLVLLQFSKGIPNQLNKRNHRNQQYLI